MKILAVLFFSALLNLFVNPLLKSGMALAGDKDAPPSTSVSQSQVLKLSEGGLEPKTLRIKKEDSIVFFLNSTKDSLATIEVDFGDKVTHCASSNMEIKKAGVISSLKPFGPRDFASMCFHDRGVYPVKVLGLKSNPHGVSSEIIVE